MILSPGLAPLVQPMTGRVIISRQTQTDVVRTALYEFLRPAANEQDGFKIGEVDLGQLSEPDK